MIAFQTTTSNRALGASRGSRPTNPPHNSNRALGASRGSRPTHAKTVNDNYTATERANPTPQPYKLPEHIIESNLLDALLDASFDLPDLCIHFKLSPHELLDYLESPETKQLLETLTKIAEIREKMIASQARVAATHRLSELARHGHITDSPREARANETARKAAAQLLRAPPKYNPKSEPGRPRPVPTNQTRHISEQSTTKRRDPFNPTPQHPVPKDRACAAPSLPRAIHLSVMPDAFSPIPSPWSLPCFAPSPSPYSFHRRSTNARVVSSTVI